MPQRKGDATHNALYNTYLRLTALFPSFHLENTKREIKSNIAKPPPDALATKRRSFLVAFPDPTDAFHILIIVFNMYWLISL